VPEDFEVVLTILSPIVFGIISDALLPLSPPLPNWAISPVIEEILSALNSVYFYL